MVINNKRQHAVKAAVLMGIFAILALFPEQVHAASAGGGLPWETPLQTIARSIQGPVAYVISLVAMIGCGAALVWGGEINEFMRKCIMLVLVISLIVFAAGILSTLFGQTGACI